MGSFDGVAGDAGDAGIRQSILHGASHDAGKTVFTFAIIENGDGAEEGLHGF